MLLWLRHIIEYLGSLLGLFILSFTPYFISKNIIQLLAKLWFCFDKKRRTIAIDNILKAKITDSKKEATRIAKDSFVYFGLVFLDSIRSHRLFKNNKQNKHFDVSIPEETMKILDGDKGLILTSGHFGNWEVAAQYLSFKKKVVGITRKINNPYVNKLMLKLKPTDRFKLTPKHDLDGTRLLRFLKEGYLLAILIDQHARDRGMIIDFFGRPASSHTSFALLHLITQTPICFGYCVRTGDMKFKIVAEKPFILKPSGNKEKDIRTILEKNNQLLEKAIRLYPEQYLWAHRRWKIKMST